MPIFSRLQNFNGNLTRYFSLKLTKKTSLIFIFIFTAVMVFDSTIIRFSTYSEVELTPSTNFWIFVAIFAVYAVGGITLINSVNRNSPKSVYRLPLRLRFLHRIILGTQILTIGIILIIILQMTISTKYSLVLLNLTTYLSHVSALIFLGILLITLIGWLKSRRNYIIVLYTFSFLLISVNVIISLVYLETYFSRSPVPFKKAYPITFYVTTLYALQYTELLASTFDFLSISSFLAIWIATIILLNQYRYKLGRVKFFALIGIPLIYYLFPFEAYFGNVLSTFTLAYPMTFSLIYVLTFSATKQVGALLFSLAFLSASSHILKDRVRISVLVSSIGVAMVFGSIEIVTLQYTVYPPYGLITQSFLPLGSYLLLIGIFTSAVGVSQDANLRKEFYKSAKSQLGLLKTIGVTQMEKELENKFRSVEKRTRMLETTEEIYTNEEDVREILRDVLNELYSKAKDEKPD